MNSRLRPGWVIFGTAAIVIVLDQLSKRWIEGNLPIGESLVPFPSLVNFFTITHFTNTGAAFGLLQGQSILFVAIGIAVAVAIVIYMRYLPRDQFLVQLALGLQLGGALGNMIDRVRQGWVTDFIFFHFWPAFNVADMAIVAGVGLMALLLLLQKEEHPGAAPAEGGAEEQRA